MGSALAPASLALLVSLSLLVVVLVRTHKELYHWLLCALLSGLVLWSAGVLVRVTAITPGGIAAGLNLSVAGILAGSAFWVLVASYQLRPRRLFARRDPTLIVLVPPALLALALLTNEGHRLFFRKLDAEAVASGPQAYVGPLFWVFLSWVYACMGAGAWLYARAARHTPEPGVRRRRALLAALALMPVAASTVYVFRLLPVRFDLTPITLVAILVLMGPLLFRNHLFEGLARARNAVVDGLDEGVVMATADGRITDGNRAAARLLGEPLRRGQSLVRALSRLGPEDDADAAGRALASLLEGEAETSELRTPDGRVTELEAAWVTGVRGERVAQLAILRDHTEQSRIETLARQTRRLETVGALAAGVAHEVNDPLAFLRANLVEIERLGRVVDEQRDGPEAELAGELASLRTLAAGTLELVEHMRRIVEDLRGLFAGDAEEAAGVELDRAVRDALFFANLGDVPNLEVEVSLPPMPRVKGHPERIFRAVANLLVNARQAVEGVAAARVRIAARRNGDDVELAVEDNGPGIPESVRDRIFDPFFTTRAAGAGSGLGLTIAFDIARQHGGGLEERSLRDAGARFVLRLPVLSGAGAGGEMEARLQ